MELEIKARIENLDKIEKKLKELNARLIKTVLQKDIYFSPPGKKFAGTKKYYLRIRFGKNASFDYHIVHSNIETEELEVNIGNPNLLKRILLQLGFSIDCMVEKKRKIFEIPKFHIAIDDVKGLGNFVEVEAKSDKMQTEDLFEMISELGINKSMIVKGSGYPDMIMLKDKV